MTDAFKEALRRAKAVGSPEAGLLHGFYDGWGGTDEELQASTDEMMAVLLSLQFVAYSGKLKVEK